VPISRKPSVASIRRLGVFPANTLPTNFDELMKFEFARPVQRRPHHRDRYAGVAGSTAVGTGDRESQQFAFFFCNKEGIALIKPLFDFGRRAQLCLERGEAGGDAGVADSNHRSGVGKLGGTDDHLSTVK